MTFSSAPFANKKVLEIKGRKMAYIDEGEGDPIVFQHGNPTSSYLWRNVMPASRGLGRLIACDLIGMGDSEKLPDSGPNRYTYDEQRSFLWALWEELGLTQNVVLVLHDWGSALGFDWANHHRDRIQGIAYMEAFVLPLAWSDFPERIRDAFRAIRSPQGEDLILRDNIFVEQFLPTGILRTLDEDAMAEYRRPFLTPGEDRRPTLTWPRQVPIDEVPPEVVTVVQAYADWLSTSAVPKLAVQGEPGLIDVGRYCAFSRTWPNQRVVSVKGVHFVQEDSPGEVGQAVAEFVRGLRGSGK